jgi:hypothetical protein
VASSIDHDGTERIMRESALSLSLLDSNKYNIWKVKISGKQAIDKPFLPFSSTVAQIDPVRWVQMFIIHLAPFMHNRVAIFY